MFIQIYCRFTLLFGILPYINSALELHSDENENGTISLEAGKEPLTTRAKPNPLEVEVFKKLEGKPMIENLSFRQDHKNHINLSEADMTKFKIWPNGIAPYYIDTVSFDETISNMLRNIISDFNKLSNFRLVELTRPPDDEDDRWLLFLNRRNILDCQDYSTNSFTTKGVQRVLLGYDCFGYEGNLLVPTFLAIAGIPPQHNAPNRNEYITIVMDNVIPDKRDMFQILKDDEWLFHHLAHYDYNSAGHYNFHKYSINGSATIIPLHKIDTLVGEQDGISVDDITKLITLYSDVSSHRNNLKTADCHKIFKSKNNLSQHEEYEDAYYMPSKVPPKQVTLTTVENVNAKIISVDQGKSEQKTTTRKYTEMATPNNTVTTETENTTRPKSTMHMLARPKKLMKLKKKVGKIQNKKELKELIKHKIDYRTSSEE